MPEAKYSWPVIGHQKIVSYLQTSLRHKNLGQAYLIAGPEHLGKHLLCDCLILSLICQEDDKEKPCFECSSCRQYKKGIHPDISLVNKEEDKNSITIEQIRELKKRLGLHAVSVAQKISLISPAESMSKGAQNALLKILEEPLGPTIHILISHEADSLLPTIKSRCQILKLLPVAKKIIEEYLKKGISAAEAGEIASLSMGRPGLALRFSQERETLRHYTEESMAFLNLLPQNIAYKFESISGHLKKEYNYNQIVRHALGLLNNWQRVIRDLILIKKDNKNSVVNVNLLDQLEDMSQNISLAKLVNIQLMIKEARKNIKHNVNPRLVLENLVINI